MKVMKIVDEALEMDPTRRRKFLHSPTTMSNSAASLRSESKIDENVVVEIHHAIDVSVAVVRLLHEQHRRVDRLPIKRPAGIKPDTIRSLAQLR